MIDHGRPHLTQLARILRGALLAGAASALVASCGAKVVVDEASDPGGAGGAGGGSSSVASSGAGGLSCGEIPQEGKIVAVCVSMQGDFCPPAANTPGLLETLADAMKVCAKTGSGACCGQAALVQVVCDLPPAGSECCYHAHYFESAPCN
jgi:hypothetical protein